MFSILPTGCDIKNIKPQMILAIMVVSDLMAEKYTGRAKPDFYISSLDEDGSACRVSTYSLGVGEKGEFAVHLQARLGGSYLVTNEYIFSVHKEPTEKEFNDETVLIQTI